MLSIGCQNVVNHFCAQWTMHSTNTKTPEKKIKCTNCCKLLNVKCKQKNHSTDAQSYMARCLPNRAPRTIQLQLGAIHIRVCCLLLATCTERALHLNDETFSPAPYHQDTFYRILSLFGEYMRTLVCVMCEHGAFAFRLYAAARSSIYPSMCVRMITHTHTEAQKTSLLPLLFRLLFFPHTYTHTSSHRI